jgi:hypothetical protein
MASDEVRSHGIEGIEGRIWDRSAFIYLKHTHLTGSRAIRIAVVSK